MSHHEWCTRESEMLMDKGEEQMSIPHLFRCPISLDLFTDPVILSTGQTYDRPSIEKWLADGHSTCPITMQRLDDMSLVPNLALRHLIDHWILDDTNLGHISVLADMTDGTESSLATLKNRLQCENTTTSAKLRILKKVRILVLESDTAKNCLVRLGFFAVLLQSFFANPVAHSAELVEVGLDCVLGLMPFTQLDSCNILKECNHLASLVLLMEQGNVKIKTGLCHLIEAMSASSLATQELCQMIGQSRRILQVLVSLMHTHTKSERTASEAAVRAIASICSIESNRPNAIAEGAVNGLITFLASSSAQTSIVSSALETLEALLGLEAGKMAAAKIKNATDVLVKHVFVMPPDDGASEHAVGTLLVVCTSSCRARVDALDAGAVTQLLLLLQSQCSSRAKARARALLKLLASSGHEESGVCF